MTRQYGRGAVFLDRDGTIIEDRGYLREPTEVAFLPGAIPALARLQGAYVLIIVTNQPGVAEGALSSIEVERVNAEVVEQLRLVGVKITATYYCPHGTDDGCSCRKPAPLLLQQAAEQYGVNLLDSYVIGDHPSDVQVARNAGATGVYVLTGHGSRHLHALPDDCPVKENVAEAADWILQRRLPSDVPPPHV